MPQTATDLLYLHFPVFVFSHQTITSCCFHKRVILNTTLHFFLPLSIYYSNVLSSATPDNKLA